MKGLANMRSILTAVKARVYSRAFSNGCISGFKFLGWTTAVVPSGLYVSAERESALIFYHFG
jgi:hypothetical protein